jgi:AcrR family transcriptional regulator
MLCMTQGYGLRDRKKAKLERALFTEAIRLFEERGYAGTSVDDIAAAADVSRKTFFRHFASKEDVVVRDEARKIAIVDRALANRLPGESVPAAIGRSLYALAEYYANEPDVVVALYRLGNGEPVLGRRLLEHHATWQLAIARSVGSAMATDARTDIRPHVMAAAALAAARLGLSEWVAGGCVGNPAAGVSRRFEVVRPALELLAVVPTGGASSGDQAGGHQGQPGKALGGDRRPADQPSGSSVLDPSPGESV